MVIAHHLIWMVYGYWLPNDPRGSMSRVLKRDLLAELGALHYGRKRLQPASRDIRSFYDRAKNLLTFPVLDIKSAEQATIAEAFARTMSTCRYTCYACAIMPDHIHILMRKHRHRAEEMITHLQRESHLLLRERGLRDLEHPVWGGHGWKVFLDHPSDVRRTIGYITQNPMKARLPAQRFNFVSGYDNWPLHEGHDPGSPYARRMRAD